MEIPKQIVKPIEEIKNPILKAFLYCLIGAVIFLVGLVVMNNQENKNEVRRLNSKVDFLQEKINERDAAALKKETEDNIKLRRAKEINDSLNGDLNYIMKELKRKSK